MLILLKQAKFSLQNSKIKVNYCIIEESEKKKKK